jgi:hypothetical protein
LIPKNLSNKFLESVSLFFQTAFGGGAKQE